MKAIKYLAFSALALIGSAPAFGSTVYTYVNSTGTNSYEAIFTLDSLGVGGTGDLTVQLINLQTSPVDDTGEIAGVNFTLSGTPGAITTPTSYSGGQVATANSNGTLTQV